MRQDCTPVRGATRQARNDANPQDHATTRGGRRFRVYSDDSPLVEVRTKAKERGRQCRAEKRAGNGNRSVQVEGDPWVCGIVSGKRLRQRLRFPEAWPDLYDGLQARPIVVQHLAVAPVLEYS
jgi:hypothetical protein